MGDTVPAVPDPGPARTGLPTAAGATLALGVVCTVVAGLDSGATGAVSAAGGAALVALFFWTGLLPVLLTRGQEGRAALGLLVLLVNYTLRLVVALVGLQALERAGLIDPRVLGITVILATLVWTSAQVVALLGGGRARTTPAAAKEQPGPSV